MKKMKSKGMVIILMVVLLLAIANISKAAVESKAGTTPYTNITVSGSYQLCYDIRNADSTLGNNSLDPHLTLVADWGAVAYLGASSYGGVRDANGTAVMIEGRSYKSTTKNITGVMNMGVKYTQTASLMGGNAGNYPGYTTKLKNNLETKYVENLSTSNNIAGTKGQGYAETKGWYGSPQDYPTSSYPVGTRIGVFGSNNSTATQRRRAVRLQTLRLDLQYGIRKISNTKCRILR